MLEKINLFEPGCMGNRNDTLCSVLFGFVSAGLIMLH